MVDDTVDASERRGRIDIRTGLAVGARGSEVARRHDIDTSASIWVAQSGADWPSGPPVGEPPMFVPVVTATCELGAAGAAPCWVDCDRDRGGGGTPPRGRLRSPDVGGAAARRHGLLSPPNSCDGGSASGRVGLVGSRISNWKRLRTS